MKRLTLLLLLSGIGLSLSVQNEQASAPFKKEMLTIVENGTSDYCINGEPVASELLRGYIIQSTGVKLPVSGTRTRMIRITVNTAMQKEGFRVSTRGRKILLEGGSVNACTYCVNWFAEEYMGIRKLSPTYSIVPTQARLTVPAGLQYDDKPYSGFRVILGEFRKDEAYRLWTRTQMIDDWFSDDYWFVHTLDWLLPKELFTSHPEYFAQINGKRSDKQVCLSNPDVFDIVCNNLLEDMNADPGVKYWSVSQGDNNEYCNCPVCQRVNQEEGANSGTLIRFVNRVAGRFPDKVISTLAYLATRHATLTRPLPNVQVMITTIQDGRGIPIADDPRCIGFVEDIKAWKKLTDNLLVWDYEVNFRHLVMPFPNLHTVVANLKFFCREGVRMHIQQANTGVGHEFSELKSYLISKLLWNPEQDADAIINEFLTGYYGEASGYIKQYIDLLQNKQTESGLWLYHYSDPYEFRNTFLSDEIISQGFRLLDNARLRVTGDPERLLHVRAVRLQLEYAVIELGIAGKADIDSFTRTCEQIGNVKVNENNLLWSDWNKRQP